MVAQTRHSGQHASPSKAKLAFHEKLLAKGVSTDALLKKLKTVHAQLAELDQDYVDTTSLSAVRKELVNTSLLLHKDRGVKAYVACCLADILRLYAPDAPYTQAELRDIFQFFFRQLSTGLKGTDSSYYDQYFHLLESLSTVKSVVLVCDLPNAEELMAEVFRDFFTMVKRDLAKKIEIFMVDILVALIEESQSVPSEVLETIMAQFMDKNARIEQPSYRLAVSVCTATADKLQRHVCQYFTDIIVSSPSTSSPRTSPAPQSNFDDIRTAHELVKRLHRSCPNLLHSVIPQLEEELRVEDVTLRGIATQVLGEMYADKGGADLVKRYPSTWTLWLARKNDKAVQVRLKFIDAAKSILGSTPEVRPLVEESLKAKIMDPDEKVRAATCRIYAQMDYESVLHHVSEDLLKTVAGHAVRVEALNAIGKLYGLAYPEIENGDPAALKHFSWIPEEILSIAGASMEIRSVVEQVVADHIFPLPSPSATTSAATGKSTASEVDEVAWTERLLNTMRFLSDKSVNALLSLTGLKTLRPSIFDHYADACVKYNGGIIDENEELVTRRLKVVVQHIAGTFPEQHKASEDLLAFAKANEGRLYKLLKTCMDPQTDIKSLVKATNEFQKRLDQVSSSINPTMNILLRRASYRIVNQSSVPTLIKRMQKGSTTSVAGEIATYAQRLLAFTSKHSPAVFKPHIGELTKAIADEKHVKLVEVCLQALAGVVRWDEKLAPSDKRTNERIARLALQSDVRQAKFAARFLGFSKNKEAACTEIVNSIVESLPNVSEDELVARIAVLAQFAKFAPDAFEHKSDTIMDILVKKVLMTPSPVDDDQMDDDEEWFEDDEVPAALSAKLLAIKVCRNRCLAHASSEKALEIAAPVLKMLATLLDYSGSMSSDIIENPKFMSRMRLQAAVSLLHLSTIEVYANALSPRLLRLAVVIQDSCYNVRIEFLTKLILLLQPRKLPTRYNVIPFLTVHDPEADVKNMASSYIQNAIRKMNPLQRVEHFEIIFIRLLHLLAHHPDFNTTHEDLVDIAKYVQFYVDLIVNQETVSLIYHLASKGKTVRDPDSHGDSENFYVMCELAQDLIKNRAQLHSWSIPSYPGKVKMPSDIFRPHPSAEVAKKVMSTIYLPEETRKWLSELTKPATKPTAIKEKKERKPPVKRKAPSKPNGQSKRARTNGKKWRSDDDDDDDDDDDEPSVTEDSDGETDTKELPEERPRGTRTSARTAAKGRITRASKKDGSPSSDR
ncbi:armadillo-type protein [Cyathus striatus]|nr:armadillo-type protein [Cyathus striatus]